MNASPEADEIVDLVGPDRDLALPAIRDSFVGVYRWHAKRTLGRIASVRAIRKDGEVVGVSLTELLVPEVGYVFYVAVRTAHRRRGIGRRLLHDALERFAAAGARVAYAAVEEDNAPSLALFQGLGFRAVARKELGYQEGGLGAWGLRSRMLLVHGEKLLGRRLDPPPEAARSGPGSAPNPR